MLNEETAGAFSLKLGKVCLLLRLLLILYKRYYQHNGRRLKRVQSTEIGKEGVILLFAHDVTIHMENAR